MSGDEGGNGEQPAEDAATEKPAVPKALKHAHTHSQLALRALARGDRIAAEHAIRMLAVDGDSGSSSSSDDESDVEGYDDNDGADDETGGVSGYGSAVGVRESGGSSQNSSSRSHQSSRRSVG